MLNGMSLDQFKEVVQFVQEHHKFARWLSEDERTIEKIKFPNLPEYGFNIKYIDSCYDSRDSTICSISFRGMGNDLVFRTNHYTGIDNIPATFNYANLYDWVMDYLKGDFTDSKILKDCKLIKK